MTDPLQVRDLRVAATEMKADVRPDVSDGAKIFSAPVITLEAFSSAHSMGSVAESLPSPEGLKPVRTAWKQPQNIAKVPCSCRSAVAPSDHLSPVTTLID